METSEKQLREKREKINAYQRQWRKRNPEKYAAIQKRSQKKFFANHRERVYSFQISWRRRHREQWNALMKHWRERNPEKWKAILQRSYKRRKERKLQQLREDFLNNKGVFAK